jgi:hypothetical protein
MHRIDTSTAQVDKFGAGKNGFTGGNPQTGELPTALDETFFDSIQEEICAIIEGAGVTLDKTKNAQALAALKLLFQPLKENLTALAGLTGAANKFPIFTGAGAMGLADISTLATTAALAALLPKRIFAATDFIRIPDVSGGLIIQWGTVAVPASSSSIFSLSTIFPNAGLAAIASAADSTTATSYRVSVGSGSPFPTTSQIRLTNTYSGNAINAFYIAIGY